MGFVCGTMPWNTLFLWNFCARVAFLLCLNINCLVRHKAQSEFYSYDVTTYVDIGLDKVHLPLVCALHNFTKFSVDLLTSAISEHICRSFVEFSLTN